MTSDNSLEEYAGKRHFGKTSEPEPIVKETGLNRFVVQEHHASRLHWDFRLEMDGVLKSWAVPKGVPEEPGVRRLAVQTEDHPVDYIDFEGHIAEGQYGAGDVKIWDSGTYTLDKRRPDEILVTLEGKRLHGGYALINTRDDQWLMMKRKT